MPINLSTVDLNLMVVFNAVMEERNVSLAGKRLGMSQSATSNALQRLRQTLKDPLFVRSGSGMQPTARALELAGPINDALQTIHNALEPRLFEPEATNWVFNIAISDVATVVLLPHLAPLLESSGANIRFWPKVNSQIQGQLDSNRIDFAIGIMRGYPKRMSRLPLFEDRYVCLMREGHPLAENLTIENYLAADHVVVRTSGEAGNLFDSWITSRGMSRRIRLNVGQFLVIPEILKSSDMLVSLANRTAAYLAQSGDLVIRELPFDFEPVEVALVWHAALSELPSHRWMKRVVLAAMKKVPATPSVDGTLLVQYS